MKIFTVMALVLASAVGAAAQTGYVESYMSGEKLHTVCQGNPEATSGSGQVAFNQGQCNGFVAGVASTIDTSEWNGDGTYASQMVAVVELYLNNHPEEWNKGAAWLVKKALLKAFPHS